MARRRNTKALESAQAELLAELRAEFAAFRKTHRPRTRVPERLRMQALKAIDAGVGPTAVSRASGVTRTQLSRWRGQRGTAQRPMDGDGAQILTVVEADAERASGEAVELEMALGSLQVRIGMRSVGTGKR